MDKVQRYDWAKPGDIGQQCMVRVEALQIDHTYQRGEVSEKSILTMSRAFNWVAFGTIVVMERTTGGRFVVDGQQRLLAVLRRGDIHQVPCVMFQSDGPEHEARAFLALNVARVPVTAVSKFKASVLAGTFPEKPIADWLATIGLRVGDDTDSVNVIAWPAAVIKTWTWNMEYCKRAVVIQRAVNGPETLVSAIHLGIFFLLTKGINIEEHTDKLRRLGGKLAMLRSIKSVQIETDSANTYTASGIGILRLINYRRSSKKITLSAES